MLQCFGKLDCAASRHLPHYLHQTPSPVQPFLLACNTNTYLRRTIIWRRSENNRCTNVLKNYSYQPFVVKLLLVRHAGIIRRRTPHLSSRLTLSSRKTYLEKDFGGSCKIWVIAVSTSDGRYAAATL